MRECIQRISQYSLYKHIVLYLCVLAHGILNMFKLISKQGRARRGELITKHGAIQTPVFMNVATQAAIKGALSSEDLTTVGCQVALSNTYHLHVRPGDELIRSQGGLHRFMAWNGPILTDSGGFQIFSLAGLRKITEEGVAFRSHVDGRKIFMSPEDSIRIQSNLGSDIAMAFDECIEIPSPRDYVERSCDRTYNWLVRCRDELERQNKVEQETIIYPAGEGTGHSVTLHSINSSGGAEYGSILYPAGCTCVKQEASLCPTDSSGAENSPLPQQVLFGINQGATFEDIRIVHMKRIAELDLPGYAIGGLAVGETTMQMYDIISTVEEYMPENRPRYLMGVGTPQNIVEAVARGIDFFDCVMPARNGRHGRFYTWSGSLNINNERYKDDGNPIDAECDCPVCRTFSRAYIRHLFRAGEMLAMRLAVLHNLYYYNTLMARIRESIEKDEFDILLQRIRTSESRIRN